MVKSHNEIQLGQAVNMLCDALLAATTALALSRGAILKSSDSLTYKYKFVNLLEGNIERTTVQTFMINSQGYLELVDTDVTDKPAA